MLHNTRLRNLMENARKHGLVFNPQKTHVKATAVKLYECLYDKNGVHPDTGKVEAIHTIPVPTTVIELQVFLGMATYLNPFIPGRSMLTAPLRGLLKKDVEFSWDKTYDSF